ncbi:MAG: D-glycero-beta-D-manno-heptose-7-phosphate kinase [Bacteroidia bacterium]|nr:MAG: D-glycero-beta-D-manno-heptose-7-phosphate kinase [Bacteroidia bacterium]
MTDKNTITRLFHSFEGKKLLIIGDVMIDAYLWGSVDRVSPEAPVPIVTLNKRESRLGGAANVAMNIQNMGGIPVLCSVIGSDSKGELFLELLDEEGLTNEGIITSDNRLTTVKFRVFGNNVQMLRVDEEVAHYLKEDEAAKLMETISGLINSNGIDAIVFEDYDKGVISPTMIENVLKLAGKHDIPVVVDPKKKNFSQYKGVTLIKPNLKELREGLNLNGELIGPEQINKAVLALQDKLEVEIVLATLSDKGIYYSRRTANGNIETGSIPAYIRDVADVSGAGDTVISLAALCVAVGAPVELMARICNLGGGLVCEMVGVVPVNKDKLLFEALKKFCQN